MKKYKHIIIIALLHLVPAAAVAAVLAFQSDRFMSIFVLHLLIVCLYLLVLISAAFFISGTGRIVYKRIFSFLTGMVFLFFIFLYTVDIISSLLWDRLISYKFIVSVFLQFYDLLGVVPFLPLAVGIYLFLIIVLFLFFYQKAYHIFSESSELFKVFNCGFMNSEKKLSFCFFLPGVLLLFSFIMLKPLYSYGEPLRAFFIKKHIDSQLVLTPHRLKQMKRDSNVRNTYQFKENLKKRNVILIVVDALRNDHLSFSGYHRETTPFISELVKDKRLRKISPAFSTTSESFGGVMSILTSKNYKSISYNNYSFHDLLKDWGYKIHMLLSGDHTNFCDLKYFFGKSVDYYFDGTCSKKYRINDDRIILEALDGVQDFSGTPSFFYFHLLSAHVLGTRQKKFARYQPTLVDIRYKDMVSGRYSKKNMINYYDNGICQGDAIIKKIFFEMKRKGYLENTILWIVADHGDSFGEHDHFGHGKTLYQEEIDIPMLVYGKGTDSLEKSTCAGQIDIAPTTLDIIGLEKPVSWQGRSLAKKQREGFSYHETRNKPGWKSVIWWNHKRIYKYIVKLKRANNSFTLEKEELYHLNRDPREEQNIIQSVSPEIAALMRKKYHDFFEKKSD